MLGASRIARHTLEDALGAWQAGQTGHFEASNVGTQGSAVNYAGQHGLPQKVPGKAVQKQAVRQTRSQSSFGIANRRQFRSVKGYMNEKGKGWSRKSWTLTGGQA
jgi:hypothetical protein